MRFNSCRNLQNALLHTLPPNVIPNQPAHEALAHSPTNIVPDRAIPICFCENTLQYVECVVKQEHNLARNQYPCWFAYLRKCA